MNDFTERIMTMMNTNTQTPVFGIDLGTTNTCIAVYSMAINEPMVLSNLDSSPTTPSVLWVNKENNDEIVVGKEAKSELGSSESVNCIRGSKRLLAKNEFWTADGIFKDNTYPEVHGVQLTPQSVASEIIKAVIGKTPYVLENVKDGKPKVVVTFPAYFTDEAKARTQQAIEKSGVVEYIDMIEEPVAAAYSYVYKMSPAERANKKVFVYDWGGGTFDASIVAFDSEGKVGKVIAKEGNDSLGGQDCDNDIAWWLWTQYCQEVEKAGSRPKVKLEKKDFDTDKTSNSVEVVKLVGKFREYAEAAKVDLNSKPKTRVIHGEIEIQLTREKFDAEIRSRLEATFDKVAATLDAGKIENTQIDMVCLVGGSTLMPCVREELEKTFSWQGKCLLNDPHEAVAKGAAIYANQKVNSGKEKFEGALTIKNIANLSYGIQTVDEKGEEQITNLIFKGDVLPATVTRDNFVTFRDWQSEVHIRVFTSDSKVEDCKFNEDLFHELTNPDQESNLLKFERPVPKGTPIEVTYTLESSGLLKVVGKSKVCRGYCEFQIRPGGVLSDEKFIALRDKMKGSN